MNYYPHHIGDFNAATRHLTRVERSLYRDAIEMYYDKEKSLTGDFNSLSRRLMATTEEEKEGLRFVLSEFFELVDGRYINDRCEEEILTYHANQSNKSKAGKASAEAKKKRAEERRAKNKAENQQKATGVEQVLISVSTDCQHTSTNQEPVTSNQEPITNKEKHALLDLLAEKSKTKVGRIPAFEMMIDLLVRDGASAEDIAHVINFKCDQLVGSKFDKGLLPKNIFDPKKFFSYLAEAGDPPDEFEKMTAAKMISVLESRGHEDARTMNRNRLIHLMRGGS